MNFLNQTHKNNYTKLLAKANILENDIERKSSFYIIAGNSDLFKKHFNIYDFKENCIDLDSLSSDKIYLSTSSKALIRLGFNLYNGYKDNYTDPLSLLKFLDTDNYNMANYAIKLRLNK